MEGYRFINDTYAYAESLRVGDAETLAIIAWRSACLPSISTYTFDM